MKKILLLASAFVLTVAVKAQTAAVAPPVKVSPDKHDFGKIPQGKPVVFSFEIKNTTDKPVVVENSYSTCGCTTPEKITDPILPGTTVKLKVQYAAAAAGPFTKPVYIKLAGVEQPVAVEIHGEVIAAPVAVPVK